MPARYAGTRSRPGRLGHGQELTRLWPRSNMLATPARCAGHPLAPAVCAGPEGHSNTDTTRQIVSFHRVGRRLHDIANVLSGIDYPLICTTQQQKSRRRERAGFEP